MADLHKAYKAHLPTEWAHYDDAPRKEVHRGHLFRRFMPDTSSGNAALLEAQGGLGGVDRRRRPKLTERWGLEMGEYMAREAQRRATAARSKELNKQLERKREVYLARREREVETPAGLDTTFKPHVTASLVASPDSHQFVNQSVQRATSPASIGAAKVYSQLLQSASQGQLEHARAVATEKVQQRLDAVARKSHARDEVRDRQFKELQEDRRDHAEALRQKHNTAHSHATTQRAEHDAEGEAHRAEEHARSVAREERSAANHRQRRQERHDAFTERAEAVRRQTDETRRRKDIADAEEEARQRQTLEDAKTRLFEREVRRQRHVGEGHIQRAQDLAAERRAVQRAKQLADAEVRSTKRAAAIREKIEDDELLSRTRRAKREAREQRSRSALDQHWDARKEKIAATIRKGESPPKAYTPAPRHTPGFLSATFPGDVAYGAEASDSPDRSLTRARMEHARCNLQRRQQQDEEKREQLAEQLNEAAYEAELRSVEAAQAQREAWRSVEAKRERAYDTAMTHRQQQKETTRRMAEDRARKVEAQLAEWREATEDARQVKSTERNEKILACLDEVNVQRREALIARHADRERRRAEFEAAEAAKRQLANDAARAAAREKQEQQMDAVEAAAQRRFERARDALVRVDEATAKAELHKEQHALRITRRMKDQGERRERQLQQREDRHQRDLEATRRKLKEKDAAIAETVQDLHEERDERLMLRRRDELEAERRALEKHYERLQDKAEKARQLAADAMARQAPYEQTGPKV